MERFLKPRAGIAKNGGACSSHASELREDSGGGSSVTPSPKPRPKSSASSVQTALAVQETAGSSSGSHGKLTSRDVVMRRRTRLVCWHWRLHRLSRIHAMPDGACAQSKHAHVMRCMRCVKVFGLKHLVRTVCKRRWWLGEVLAQEKVLNWIVFFYFLEGKDDPYSLQRQAFGWMPPEPPQVRHHFVDSDEEMLVAIENYERTKKHAKRN